jgi:hypothetical protein
MKNSIRTQFSIMVARRDFRIVFACVLAMTLYSYLVNLINYRSFDYGDIYSWHYLYAGNTSSNIWNLFSVLYPFIVVFPFGFSYMQDRKVRLLNNYTLKSGKENYFCSKIIVAFIGGFLIIAIPFMINLALTYFTFPHNYSSPFQYAQMLTGERVDRDTVFAAKPFAELFVQSLPLYNLLYLLFFSVFTGIISAFAMALSFFIRTRKILLFVPLFVIFQLGYHLRGVISNNEDITFLNTNIFDYFGTDAFYGQSVTYILSLTGAFLLFIAASYLYAVRREDIG